MPPTERKLFNVNSFIELSMPLTVDAFTDIVRWTFWQPSCRLSGSVNYTAIQDVNVFGFYTFTAPGRTDSYLGTAHTILRVLSQYLRSIPL